MPIMSSVGGLSYAKLSGAVPLREYYCLKFLPAGINSASSSFAALSSIAFDPTDTSGNVFYSASMISNANQSGAVTDNIGLIPLVGDTNVVVGNKRSFSYAPGIYFHGGTSFSDSAYNSLDDLIYNIGASFERDTSTSAGVTGLGLLVKTNADGTVLSTTTQLPKLGRSTNINQRYQLTWQRILVEPYTGFPTGRIFIGGYDTVGSQGAYGIVPQLQFVSDNGTVLSLTRWNDGAIANKTSGEPQDHTMCMARAPDGNTIVGYSNDVTSTKGAVYIRKVSSTVSGGILPTISSIGIQMGANDRLWLRDLDVDSFGNIYCVIKRLTSGVLWYHFVKLNSSYVIQYDYYSNVFTADSVCVTPNGKIFLSGRNVTGGCTIFNMDTAPNFSNGRTFYVDQPIRGASRLVADNLNNVYLTTRCLGSLPGYTSYQDFGVILKFENLSDLVNSQFSNGSDFNAGIAGGNWIAGLLTTFAITAPGTSETPNTVQSRSSLVNSNPTSSTTAWLI